MRYALPLQLLCDGYLRFHDAIDTAQSYRNEYEAGVAIRDSGLSRDELFVTTKYSGVDGKGIEQSVKESLANVRFSLPFRR